MSHNLKQLIKAIIIILVTFISLFGIYYLIFQHVRGSWAYFYRQKISPKDLFVLLIFTPNNALEKFFLFAIQSIFLLPFFVHEKNDFKSSPVIYFLLIMFMLIFALVNAYFHRLYSPTKFGKIVVSILSITDTALILMPAINVKSALSCFEPFKKLVRIWLGSAFVLIVSCALGNIGCLAGLVVGVIYYLSYKNGSDNIIVRIIYGKNL